MALYDPDFSEHVFAQKLRPGDYIGACSTGYVEAGSGLVCILWPDKQNERMDLWTDIIFRP